MKNPVAKFKGRLGKGKKLSINLNVDQQQLTHQENRKKKNTEKPKERLSDLRGNIKWSKIHAIGVLKKNRENEAEKNLKKRAKFLQIG